MIDPLRAHAKTFRQASSTRPLSFESLEDRRLLAVDVEVLKEIGPGAASGNPTELTVSAGKLYFAAAPNDANSELWKSDGTPDGTIMVKEINPGAAHSFPRQLTDVNGTLYFTAQDAANNRELWKSDGTPDGTVKVKEINPTGSAFGNAPNSITPFAHIGNTVFFRADDGVNGAELWKSDGTPEGTTRITNIHATGSSNPSYLTVVGQTLYFAATDGTDVGLWKTEATGSTVTRVKNINADGDDAVAFVTAMGNSVFFRADDGTTAYELWKSDGTPDGTLQVKDIRTLGSPPSSSPNHLTVVGNTLYFTAVDVGSNRELWKSDGTTNGTIKVKEINPGIGSAIPSQLTAVGNVLYFVATNGTNGVELWKTNGTEVGTVPVTALHRPAIPSELTNVGGVLYFAGPVSGSGNELWQSDGTDAGTHMVRDLSPGDADGNPRVITSFGGRLFLVANTMNGDAEVWRETPATYGSFDQDLDVDGADFLLWQRQLGTANPASDANRNGTVDGPDFGIWQSNFGDSQFAAVNGQASGGDSTFGSAATFALDRIDPTFDPPANLYLALDLFAAAAPAPSFAERPVALTPALPAPMKVPVAAFSSSPPTVAMGSRQDWPDALSDELTLEVVDAAFAEIL